MQRTPGRLVPKLNDISCRKKNLFARCSLRLSVKWRRHLGTAILMRQMIWGFYTVGKNKQSFSIFFPTFSHHVHQGSEQQPRLKGGQFKVCTITSWKTQITWGSASNPCGSFLGMENKQHLGPHHEMFRGMVSKLRTIQTNHFCG